MICSVHEIFLRHQIKVSDLGGECGTNIGEKFVQFSDEKPESGRPLEIWQDYLKVDIEETGWEKWD